MQRFDQRSNGSIDNRWPGQSFRDCVETKVAFLKTIQVCGGYRYWIVQNGFELSVSHKMIRIRCQWIIGATMGILGICNRIYASWPIADHSRRCDPCGRSRQSSRLKSCQVAVTPYLGTCINRFCESFERCTCDMSGRIIGSYGNCIGFRRTWPCESIGLNIRRGRYC